MTTVAVAASPPREVAPATVRPAWPTAALLLSGLVIVILETPNLLFFLGLILIIAGIVYALGGRGPAPERS